MNPKIYDIIWLGDIGDDCLRTPAKAIFEVTDKVRSLCDDMKATMFANDGLGLAAPQIGISKRIIVVRLVPNNDDTLILINPEVVSSEGKIRGSESCLSLPGISVVLERAERIVVKALDIQGEESAKTFEGLMAVVLQHEIDHLNGILITDHLKGLALKMTMKRYRKRLKKRNKSK